MKAIDKTTEKQESQEQYHYGDILKCWDDGDNGFDLYQISRCTTTLTALKCAVLIHDCEGDMSNRWRGSSADAINMINSLKRGYDHVVKVRAHIVIDEVLSEGKDDEDY